MSARPLGFLLGLAALLLSGCPGGRGEPHRLPVSLPVAGRAPSRVQISVRAGKIRNFPCMQCHDKVRRGGPDPLRNKHRDLVVRHFKGMEDCYRCHSDRNMDHLRLQTGVTVTIDDSEELCGECHALKARDWAIGAHGKMVGGWRGLRQRLTCTDCHDPHHPRIEPVTALPGPPFPRGGIPKAEGGH